MGQAHYQEEEGCGDTGDSCVFGRKSGLQLVPSARPSNAPDVPDLAPVSSQPVLARPAGLSACALPSSTGDCGGPASWDKALMSDLMWAEMCEACRCQHRDGLTPSHSSSPSSLPEQCESVEEFTEFPGLLLAPRCALIRTVTKARKEENGQGFPSSRTFSAVCGWVYAQNRA